MIKYFRFEKEILELIRNNRLSLKYLKICILKNKFLKEYSGFKFSITITSIN